MHNIGDDEKDVVITNCRYARGTCLYLKTFTLREKIFAEVNFAEFNFVVLGINRKIKFREIGNGEESAFRSLEQTMNLKMRLATH